MATRLTWYANDWGLHCYQTGGYVRGATKREIKASREAARSDGGAGVIDDSDLSRPVGSRVKARLVAKVEVA